MKSLRLKLIMALVLVFVLIYVLKASNSVYPQSLRRKNDILVKSDDLVTD